MKIGSNYSRIDKSSKFSLSDTSNESGRFNLEGGELSSS